MSIKSGRAKVNESLGEYGKMEAYLKDLQNPYSGLSLFSDKISTIGVVLTIIFVLIITEYTKSIPDLEDYSILIGLTLMIAMTLSMAKVIRYFQIKNIKKKMELWIEQHPGIDVNSYSDNKSDT